MDPAKGQVHLGQGPAYVKVDDQDLDNIRTDFMQKGIATPVQTPGGTVIIAHGSPPVNGVRHWFIGPDAAAFEDDGQKDGWLTEEQAKKWAASKGHASARFVSCYNPGAFDNTGKLQIGVPDRGGYFSVEGA